MRPFETKTLRALPALLMAPFVTSADDGSPVEDLARLMPAGTVLYVEAPGLSGFLESGLEHPFLATVLESRLGDALRSEADLPPEEALAFADAYLGRPALPTLASLTAEGLAFGMSTKRGEPVVSIAVRGDDPELWAEMLRFALGRVAEEHGLDERAMTEPHARVRGFDVWYLGEELTLGLQDTLLLASGDEGRLRDMIDLASGTETESLATSERFRSARGERELDELAWSWVDVAAIEAADVSATAELRAMVESAGAQFLLGPIVSGMGSASETTASLRLDADRLELEVFGLGIELGAAASVLPHGETSAPALPLPRGHEGMRGLLYRDVAGLFRDRVDLFPVDVMPQFAEAVSGLALFFGGADVSDELLPAISPWVGLVVREPEFADGREPDLPLPSAAILARLEDAERIGPMLVGAFQTAIGIVNVEGAQNMQPSLVLNLELVEGIPVTSASYPAPFAGEGVDMRYNLVPACALVGDTFVLGTHRFLVAELVGQIQRGELAAPAEPSAVCERLELSGPTLTRALRDNAEALVMRAVLEEGKTREEARGEIDGLLGLGDLIERISLETARPEEDVLRLAVALELRN